MIPDGLSVAGKMSYAVFLVFSNNSQRFGLRPMPVVLAAVEENIW